MGIEVRTITIEVDDQVYEGLAREGLSVEDAVGRRLDDVLTRGESRGPVTSAWEALEKGLGEVGRPVKLSDSVDEEPHGRGGRRYQANLQQTASREEAALGLRRS